MNEFFERLKQRKLVQWAIAYVAAAFALLQGIDIVAQRFGWPDTVERTLIIATCIGFVVALILAWYHGERGVQRVTGTELLIIGLVLAVGGGFLWRFAASSHTAEAKSSIVSNETKASESMIAIPAKSIAVLPFENLSSDKENAYFADGIQDEILTRLAGIADLKVISRTSTEKYKSKPEDLKTVSRQLGVAKVLEGSVQRAADKVRVNVQLIDARGDTHLWAKSYDREVRDIFAVESEISQEIADALQAKLSPAEEKTVASAPTKDTVAYDFFLKGEYEHRAALSAQTPEPFDQASAWYKEAIAHDPNFALAMAQLVVCRMRRHWLAESLNESELSQVGEMARKALSLEPNLAEAHVALGVFHYYGFRQYEPALTEFRRAIELQPNNAEALQFIAYVHRRQGEWNRTLEELGKTLELDPRNVSVQGNIAQTYCHLREWKDAESTSRRALTIDPHEATSMGMLLLSSLNREGNARDALRLLATFPPDDLLVPNGGTLVMLIGRRSDTHVLNRDFKAAWKEWEIRPNAATEWLRLSAKTVIRVLAAGDLRDAQADAEKARRLLEARVSEHPGEIRSMRALSWVYLALDDKEEATRTARRVVELVPPEKDWGLGPANLAALAEIQARTGATKDAVRNLQRLLSIPAGEAVSIARLKVDPVWDPIRNDPGFQELLNGKELVGPND